MSKMFLPKKCNRISSTFYNNACSIRICRDCGKIHREIMRLGTMEKDIGVKEDGVCFLNCGRSENQACAAECHLRFQFITYISATSMLKITCTIRRRCHN